MTPSEGCQGRSVATLRVEARGGKLPSGYMTVLCVTRSYKRTKDVSLDAFLRAHTFGGGAPPGPVRGA